MPQLANLVLTDRATTPVSHTYVPRDVISNVATLEEGGTYPIGNKTFSISLVKTAGGHYKATLKGAFPVVQESIVNGVTNPVVVRSNYCTVTFTFASTSTEQERKDTVGLLYSALATSQTMVNDVLTKLQSVY